MSAASVVARGRRAAERLMQDEFDAFEPGWEEVDGLKEEAWVYRGSTVGKVQGLGGLRGNDPQTRTVNVGGVDRLVMNGGIHIPVAAIVPQVGWEYECVGIGPASDPSLLGRRYRVVEVPAKSYTTARRLDVVEVTAGE